MKKVVNYIIVFAMMVGVIGYAIFAGGKKTEDKDESSGRKIVVGLASNSQFTVLSDNPVEIRAGQSAVFEVDINDGYYYEENDEFSYANNQFIFENVEKTGNLYVTLGHLCSVNVVESDMGQISVVGDSAVKSGGTATVSFAANEHYFVENIMVNDDIYPAPAGGTFDFTVEDDTIVSVIYSGDQANFVTVKNTLGEIYTSSENGYYTYGEEVTLNYEPYTDDVEFIGWSVGDYLEFGGEFVGADSELNYRITGDTVMFANAARKVTCDVVIDVNNGTSDSDLSMLKQSAGTFINLPVDTGALTRSGYTLIGYNTASDGSGTFYSLGAMMCVPEGGVKLYAQWARNCEYLNYVKDADRIIITGLVDAAAAGSTVCIPSKIEGLDVTTIRAGAFSDCDGIETVIVARGITHIEDNAFEGCDRLSLVYLPETLRSLAENAFNNDPNLRHMRVIASEKRAYEFDFDSAYADKYMRLVSSQGKRLIIVGGSNLAFGLNCQMLSDAFPDYAIVNLGGSYLYGLRPALDILKNNVRQDDLVIFAPEYYDTMFATVETDTISNWEYVESNYDILNDIDLLNNRTFLTSYVDYLNKKRSILPGHQTNVDNVYGRYVMNIYGDITTPRVHKSDNMPDLPNEYLITEEGMRRINDCLRTLTDKGATCLWSYPVMTYGAFSAEITEAATSKFVEKLKASLDSNCCTVISEIMDYFVDPSLTYDSVYHLTLEGTALRTDQLIQDINGYLNR